MSSSSQSNAHLSELKHALAKAYKDYLLKVRDDPAEREKLIAAGQPPESFEATAALPDFMVEQLANGMAAVTLENPEKYMQPNASLDMKRVLEIMAYSKTVTEWFNAAPSGESLSESQLNRDGANWLCIRGKSRFEMGLFSEARVLFNKAVEIDQKNVKAWLGLSETLEALGLVAQAEDAKAHAEELER